MSGRGDPMVQIGTGIVSTAVGIAITATGADGLLLLLPSGGAMVFGVSLVVFGLRRKMMYRRTLADETESLGLAILDFLASRIADTPSEPVGPIRGYRQRRAHDEDTVGLYREKLLPDVRLLLRELLACRVIGRKEARTLLAAHDVASIERVGARLVEVAGSVPHRR